MGFLDFLFSGKQASRCQELPDKIWLTTAAKFAGIATEVDERSTADTVCLLLVAHFQDTLDLLEPVAAKSNRIPTKAVLATQLTTDLAGSLQLAESATIDLIVAERFPLPDGDAQLLEAASALPCQSRLVHHLSLDDPLMEIFAGDWVKHILGKLGMQDDECIESNMVSRRIRGAQDTLAKAVPAPQPATTTREWYELNRPNG